MIRIPFLNVNEWALKMGLPSNSAGDPVPTEAGKEFVEIEAA